MPSRVGQMKASSYCVFGLLGLFFITSGASCSSKFKSGGSPGDAGGAAGASATLGTSMGGTTGTNFGGADSSGGMGGTLVTDGTGGTAATGGGGGTRGGAAGATGGGTMGGTAGTTTGGAGGTGGSLIMKCDEGEPFCECDDVGCFVGLAGPCAQDGDCKSQQCGVTQEQANICCEQACADDQVCGASGTGCEKANPCPEGEHRCNTDYQQCVDGDWTTIDVCGALGCQLSLGGCKFDLGDTCSSDDECGAGTCQDTATGGKVCCSSNCGSCQMCNDAGNGCATPSSVPEGCACTSTDASKCADSYSCTNDICVDNACQNPVTTGCLIGGQCIAEGTKQPGNPCRGCDPNSNSTGWSNLPNGTSCDDGKWCTGDNDRCDGAGNCGYDYPTSNRCAGRTGDCEEQTCNETRKCLRPSSHICRTETIVGCLSTTCQGRGGASDNVMTWKVEHHCAGNRSDCSGGTQDVRDENATLFEFCASGTVCDPGTQACKERIDCGNTFCDSSSNLCWMASDSSQAFSQQGAIDYCNTLNFAGSLDWRLPTNDEARSVRRGCSDFCDVGDGPGVDGCYWPTEMGTCTENLWLDNTSSGYWVPANGAVGYTAFGDFKVRCVADWN